MQIIHKIDDFLVELFCQFKKSFNDLQALRITQCLHRSYNYSIGGIPGKQFSGYQILAWYYISWSIAMPDMVGQLGLNYEKEYEMAKQMSGGNK